MAAPVKVARQQTTPELSGTFGTLPPEPTLASAGTLRNPLEPSGICLRNLHQHAPKLSGTFRNLPPEPTPAHTGTLQNLLEPPSRTHTGTVRNSPEPSGTCLRNLHQHTPEPSQTCLQNLPEPSSGTSSCNPHRHTPELIWAEDPISLRWGKTQRPNTLMANWWTLSTRMLSLNLLGEVNERWEFQQWAGCCFQQGKKKGLLMFPWNATKTYKNAL